MAKHYHVCVCEKSWGCIVRGPCCLYPESICDQCLSSILSAQGPETIREILLRLCPDPSTEMRARKLLLDYVASP
jgi:hypothetical protein